MVSRKQRGCQKFRHKANTMKEKPCLIDAGIPFHKYQVKPSKYHIKVSKYLEKPHN